MILPPNILNIMAAEDRKPLGKAGLLPTECAHKQDHRAEVAMHNQYKGFLARNGLHEYLYASPNKRVRDLPPGWPDFSVPGPCGKTLYIEFKTESGTLSPDQKRVIAALRQNGHRVYVAWSYEEAVEITRECFGI
jgi:VRR-NUC domain-containing protein